MRMKKVFVDKVMQKEKDMPGPGWHETIDEWKTLADVKLAKQRPDPF